MAILISAQTAPLQRDMNTAARIAGDGAKKMKDEVDRKGSLWGDFFRGAFLLSQFKRFIHTVRQGVEFLEKSGDAASVAARGGLKEYEDAMARISGKIAVASAPGLKFFGKLVESMVEEVEAVYEVYRELITGENMDERLRKQIELQNDFAKAWRKKQQEMAAAKLRQDEIAFFNPQVLALDNAFDKHEKYIKRVEEGLKMGAIASRNAADALIEADRAGALKNLGLVFDVAPIEKFFDKIRNLNTAFDRLKLSSEEWFEIVDKATNEFLQSSGLSVKSDYDTYLEKVEQLNRLRNAGWIEESQFLQMYGAQIEKLAASQKQMVEASKAPEALIKGTAAAFSAINAFQRGGADRKKDAGEIIRQAAAEQAQRDAEQIRLGKEANQHLRKFANIEAMSGP